MRSASTYSVAGVDTLTAPPPQRVRRPAATLWSLRVALTVHLLAVLAQPVLAGLFLTGDVDAIDAHAAVALAIGALTTIVVAIAVGYVVVGRGRWWPLAAIVGLFLLEGFQIGVGFARLLPLHVPGGVLVVVASVLLAAWVWTPSAGRPRPVASLPSLQDVEELRGSR
jgi:hypothetical protein